MCRVIVLQLGTYATVLVHTLHGGHTLHRTLLHYNCLGKAVNILISCTQGQHPLNYAVLWYCSELLSNRIDWTGSHPMHQLLNPTRVSIETSCE